MGNPLYNILKERIMVLDGAMATMIQNQNPTEETYRGERFKNYPSDLKGNNDLLCITQPGMIRDIHLAFLRAGADIIETNTFNANAVSMQDYNMGELASEINLAAVKIAREACKIVEKEDGKPRFVAGSIGPTNKTASLSPDVNQPGFRAIDFDTLRDIYREQALALIEGGADILLVETVFDTLNCKAALFAINEIKEERETDIPIMVSGTITDASGRTLSGQTTEAFWVSVKHGELLSIGLNCALGAGQLRPYLETLAKKADIFTSVHPNAGLPNEFGEYDETPESMAGQIEDFCKHHFVNIVGGCCGTTPEHIKAIAEIATRYPPRALPVEQTV